MSIRKLLIVDDERALRDSTSIILEDCCDEVIVADNGQVGLEIINSEKDIFCVLTDINMPFMNGIELVKEIRSQQFDMPVIVYTAHGDKDLMEELSQYNLYDFISKPEVDGLEEIVEKAIKFYAYKKENNGIEPKQEFSFISAFRTNFLSN